MYSLLHQNRL